MFGTEVLEMKYIFVSEISLVSLTICRKLFKSEANCSKSLNLGPKRDPRTVPDGLSKCSNDVGVNYGPI